MPTVTLGVYVPIPGSWFEKTIKKGSGIVGQQMDPIHLRLDYEGAVYGQKMTYEDKLFQAAGRQLHNNGRGYPTTSRVWLDIEDVIRIGDFIVDTDTWKYLFVLTDPERYKEWTS